jgi:uncharacterized membrane protein YdbT with pleckstrin-like domain
MADFSNFHFEGQKLEEKILLVTHRHWFDILTQLFMVFLMLLIFIGSYASFPSLFPVIIEESLYRNLFLFLENLFLIFTWITFFLIWIDYYFDAWIVTDRRIVNIEQRGLFSREISELELENIQDITTEVKGVIPTFLNYGDLFVQTAAEKERFIFHNVPDPYAIKDMVMNLQKKYEDKEENQFGEMLREKIHKDFK